MFIMKKILYYFFILFLISGCAKETVEIDKIKDTDINQQMIEAYNEGLKALDEGDGIYAAKKFSEAEILFPQSIWAPRSSLMTAYSYYSYGKYQDTIAEIERYLNTYPLHERKNYAYYLLALAYYEQIVDEKKDINPILQAKVNFEIVLKDYPNSEFAVDAEFKLDLIQEILASKEMYIGRYYIEKEKWIPAINRFKIVLNQYDTTIFVEEALHRLVEIHYKIGMIEESKKYANLLGYNYQSSQWYKKSYRVFNKDYKQVLKKDDKKKQNSFLKKFKSLL